MFENEGKVIEQFSTDDAFKILWKERRKLNAEPIVMPGYKSGNDLPVSVALREIRGEGFIFGLFEQRESMGEVDHEPVGWFILEMGDDGQLFSDNRKLLAYYDEITWRKKKRKRGGKYFSRLALAGSNSGRDYGYNLSPRPLGLVVGLRIIDGKGDHEGMGLGSLLLNLGVILAKDRGFSQIDFRGITKGGAEALVKKSGHEYRVYEDLGRKNLVMKV